jgi:hypothetical protein
MGRRRERRRQDNPTADQIPAALALIRQSDERWHGLTVWLSHSGMDRDAKLLDREGLNRHFGIADGPCMNFTQLWLPSPAMPLIRTSAGSGISRRARKRPRMCRRCGWSILWSSRTNRRARGRRFLDRHASHEVPAPNPASGGAVTSWKGITASGRCPARMGAPVKSPDVGVFVRPGRLPARTGMTEDTGPKRRNKFARHERLLKSQAKHPGNRPDKIMLRKIIG